MGDGKSPRRVGRHRTQPIVTGIFNKCIYMKKIILRLLARKAERYLEKHKPRIVAITGSVGKTSTKDAIATVLEKDFRVRKAQGNYNNEFGVPLSILGEKSPGKSILGWLRILLAVPKEIPQILILEYGADRPGDIVQLCKLAPPSVSVFTAISPVHVENYDSLNSLIKEKTHIITCLPENGLAVMNVDDVHVQSQVSYANTTLVTYGFSAANVQATDYRLETKEDFSFEPGEVFSSVHFHAKTPEGEYEMILQNVIGKQQVSAALAAIAVGQYFGMSLEKIAVQLKSHRAPNGRLRPLPGVKGTLVLDDSYNAAPASSISALEVLREFHPYENSRRIAVLGNMAELGSLSESEHRMVGMRAAEVDVDILICVGEQAKHIGQGAEDAGMDTKVIRYLDNAEDAGRHLDREIKKGDIVLVKGSQSMRMEKVVKDIMAEPAHAKDLLVRQYGKWLDT